MTIDDFLVRCEDRAWRFLDDDGAIGDRNDHCPIMSMASDTGWTGCEYDDDGHLISDENYTVEDAAKYLGLTARQRRAIMAAADSTTNTPLRRKLLAACGLSSPPTEKDQP